MSSASAQLAYQPLTLARGRVWVYAVRGLACGRIKIGRTNCLARRVVQLRHLFGSEVEVLGVVLGIRETENQAHRRLKTSLFQGRELYKDTPEVRQFIKQDLKPMAHYGLVLPPVAPYQARSTAFYQLTPKKVIWYCDAIASRQSSRSTVDCRTAESFKRRLVNRLRKDAAAGIDVAPLLELVREQLGDEQGLKVAAGVRA